MRKTERLEFTKNHLDWSVEKWKTVLFSDESKFDLFGSTFPSVQKKTVGHGGGSAIVWRSYSGIIGMGPKTY